MADFFSRLVERSLNLSATVQPAIAPFGSVPAVANEIDWQPSWNIIDCPTVNKAEIARENAEDPAPPVAAIQLNRVLPPQATAVQRPSPLELEAATHPVQEHLVQEGVQHLSGTPPHPNLSIQFSSLPESNSQQLSASHLVTPTQPIAKAFNQTAPVPFRVVQPPETVERHPSVTVALSDRKLNHESKRELADESEIAAHSALIQPAPSQRHNDRATVSQSTAQPTLTDLRLPQSDSQVPSELAASPPTIRVSIGRVEVRAILPTPPVPKHTPVRSHPAVSLDAYLQQRGRKP